MPHITERVPPTANVYTDTYPQGSTCGFHHIAMFAPDLDAAIATSGEASARIARALAGRAPRAA